MAPSFNRKRENEKTTKCYHLPSYKNHKTTVCKRQVLHLSILTVIEAVVTVTGSLNTNPYSAPGAYSGTSVGNVKPLPALATMHIAI